MLGWWMLIPGPIKKALMYAAIVAVALWAFKVYWLNPHDNKIEAETRAKVTGEVKKEFDDRYQARLEILTKGAEELMKQVVELETANKELARSRAIINDSLNRSIAAAHAAQGGSVAKIPYIPASMLVGAVRDLSRQLGSAALDSGPIH